MTYRMVNAAVSLISTDGRVVLAAILVAQLQPSGRRQCAKMVLPW